MNCGTLLFDSKFQFPSGHTDHKLILVVCEYGTNFLVAQTTRQPDYKNKTEGCQIDDKPPNYFISAHNEWFNDDTWIRLDEVFEYDNDTFFYKKEDGVVSERTTLRIGLMKDILQCALKSKDIDLYYLEFIERAYDRL
jgi:hypothetical protein